MSLLSYYIDQCDIVWRHSLRVATERGVRGVGIVIRTKLDVEPVEALVHDLFGSTGRTAGSTRFK